MKKLISTLLVLACITSVSFAADAAPKKKEVSPEVKALRTELMAKYDADKDGKFSKEERAKMSAADKAKMQKINGGATTPKKKKDN